MKFVIDTEKFNQRVPKLQLDEFFYLLSIYNKANINSKTVDSCLRNLYAIGGELTGYGKEILETALYDSFKTEDAGSDRFSILAEKLRELYPTGKKEGTAYMWRDSKAVIAHKLQTLVTKYGDKFTDEEAIEATKKYVESFNGNYTYMQLLKYFILKRVNNNGEVEEVSQLLSYIENKGQVNINNDWVNEML